MNRFVAVAAAAALAASASAQTDCAGRWSNYGRCSAQCSTGTSTANYTITTQLTTGGKSCSAVDGETRTQPCTVCAASCKGSQCWATRKGKHCYGSTHGTGTTYAKLAVAQAACLAMNSKDGYGACAGL